MTAYDIFNGDADGICALQQLRLNQPREARRVSGLKREIDLLSRVSAQSGDQITVLDVSMDTNKRALVDALDAGADVFYADHHYAGEIPQHERLEAYIDPAADTCTSLIVNQYLDNAQAQWAVVGAYGDNFDAAAAKLGASIGMAETDLAALQQLGICLNYNGYGFDLDDLMYHPAKLYEVLHEYADPMAYLESEPGYQALLRQYLSDRQKAEDAQPESQSEHGAVYLLPNAAWARRVVGVMANDVAKNYAQRAHAFLIDMGDGGYRVSVRAPYQTKTGADTLCRQFESGGGREAAAGINQLAYNLLPEFLDRFNQAFE